MNNPHQILEPAVGFRGMGVISKYPIQPTGEELPLDWIGTPQVLEMDWMGRRVTLINFHMQSSIPKPSTAFLMTTGYEKSRPRRWSISLATLGRSS